MIGGYLLHMMIPLAIVTGLIILTIWLLKRFNLLPALQPVDPKESRTIKLVETLPIGRRQQLTVVEFAHKRLLLAITDNTVTCLSETDAPPPFSLPETSEGEDLI
ncbi:MAG: flagellar biosynthetic protein FliO [Zymomonas mobilis subsp. pomaceae]|uniref:Flagellar protein n=1 Tax=Zymomonas mobilis subsp. pomaceae (strain ATCC 29192 / DSM 22645 / JCM 10191 / CCUG 17912 / NBRC 13757 / NCIMB 11200 / NRRL B-4491 / Barker I) TaxID=579138 RepID=F8ERM8_ZYMMT|nr:flagellar biosynthetic protein FliO [Zymomonas mobilis]AEI37486.1 flagellar biosynthetic protein FliO [Zymomonas mobilis subsp. pomaceae ATCC 29192]MDX5948854.1 flagellar biosynthetic protein FliO [Zymomonas mobilis subsp. pomaceae]GEB88661.1 hypothetical protein ZMO02_02980 [Zymomonas mobilis subsp. pomaceae]